ncbi:MAG: hypothetical protein KA116_11075 [Proteobacteria bacterium]|nr:hypothetical protein [Pseudomonadota bacterium]
MKKWIDSLANEPQRSRIISMIVGLSFLLILPIPETFKGSDQILTFLWAAGLLNAIALGFWIDGRGVCGFLLFVLSFIYGLKTQFWLPIILLFLLYLWLKKRGLRTKVLVFILGISLGYQVSSKDNKTSSSKASKKSPKKTSTIKRVKTKAPLPPNPYPLDSMASCGYLEKISWEFRADGFRSRKLFQDYLQLSSDNQAYLWELYQTMNRRGDVTFIFRRKYDSYSYLSIAARDFTFTSALSRSKGSRTLERQNVSDFLNRPVLIFKRSDGSSVSFLPGSMGKATIMIQFAQADGRDLPPIYIRGNFCDRPATLDEGDLQEKTFGKKKNTGGILDSAPGAGGK